MHFMPDINQCTFLFRTSDLVDSNDDPSNDMQTDMSFYRPHQSHKDQNGSSIEEIRKYQSVFVFGERDAIKMLMSSRDTVKIF